MNPRDFQALAVDLLKVSSPAHNRTAIGRAYYAVFHVALEYLRSSGFAIKQNHTAHEEVSRHLGWSEHAQLMRAGSQLDDLRAARNNADYRMDNAKSESDKVAGAWVKIADACLQSLDQSFGGADKSKFVETIKRNRSKAYGA